MPKTQLKCGSKASYGGHVMLSTTPQSNSTSAHPSHLILPLTPRPTPHALSSHSPLTPHLLTHILCASCNSVQILANSLDLNWVLRPSWTRLDVTLLMGPTRELNCRNSLMASSGSLCSVTSATIQRPSWCVLTGMVV